jgi:hypothetical protein
MELCGYVDGTLKACQAPTLSPVNAILNGTNFLILGSGQQTGPTYYNTEAMIQSIQVFTCANWQTQQCNGTVLSGPP